MSISNITNIPNDQSIQRTQGVRNPNAPSVNLNENPVFSNLSSDVKNIGMNLNNYTNAVFKTRTVNVTSHGMDGKSFFGKVEQFFSNIRHNLDVLLNRDTHLNEARNAVEAIKKTTQDFFFVFGDERLWTKKASSYLGIQTSPKWCGDVLKDVSLKDFCKIVNTFKEYEKQLEVAEKQWEGTLKKELRDVRLPLKYFANSLKLNLAEYARQTLNNIENQCLEALKKNELPNKDVFEPLKTFEELAEKENNNFFKGWDSLKNLSTRYKDLKKSIELISKKLKKDPGSNLQTKDLEEIQKQIDACKDPKIKEALTDIPSRAAAEKELATLEEALLAQLRKDDYTVSEDMKNDEQRLIPNHPKLYYYNQESGKVWEPLQLRKLDLNRVLFLTLPKLRELQNGQVPSEKISEHCASVTGDLCQLTGGKLSDAVKTAFEKAKATATATLYHSIKGEFETIKQDFGKFIRNLSKAKNGPENLLEIQYTDVVNQLEKKFTEQLSRFTGEEGQKLCRSAYDAIKKETRDLFVDKLKAIQEKTKQLEKQSNSKKIPIISAGNR